MFNFEREISGVKTARVVATEGMKRTLQEIQKDIFDSHRHRAFSLAFYMSGNEMEAEEIRTSTFIRAFRTASQPDAGIVDNELIGELRERFPIGEMEPAVTASGTATLDQRRVRRTDMEEALQHLPATERLLFLLRDVEGYSSEAIAELLDMQVPQVQRALLSARLRLRQVLGSAKQSQAA